jgi:HSP20 family protein
MTNETKSKEEVVPAEKGGAVQKIAARVGGPLEEMERLMERLSEGFVPRKWLRRMRWDWPELPQFDMSELRAPRADVVERDGEILVRAEVPGVDKKDLDISVTEDAVTIKGSTRREQKEEKGEYYRQEISEASFARTIALPAAVDGTRAKATCNNGMIELVIPKVTQSKRHSVKVD